MRYFIVFYNFSSKERPGLSGTGFNTIYCKGFPRSRDLQKFIQKNLGSEFDVCFTNILELSESDNEDWNYIPDENTEKEIIKL